MVEVLAAGRRTRNRHLRPPIPVVTGAAAAVVVLVIIPGRVAADGIQAEVAAAAAAAVVMAAAAKVRTNEKTNTLQHDTGMETDATICFLSLCHTANHRIDSPSVLFV